MPMRNPFKKTNGEVQIAEDRARTGADGGFQTTSVVGAKSIDSKEPVEYQLSEINDSGVFIPPSPTEKKSFWSNRSNTSTTSSNHRSLLNENEPFNISRESFDSYRRSFDISARSPISEIAPRTSREYGRQSLDARRVLERQSRSSFDNRIDRPENTLKEEGFEDVGLNDEVKPKKRGLFSRFGDSSDSHEPKEAADSRPSSSHHGFHFMGRKRGQSGAGAELSPMSRPLPEIKVD